MTLEDETHSSGSSEFMGKVLNFLLLFGGLTFLLYKPIRSYLGERSRGIDKSLKDTKRERMDSDTKLKEVMKRLDELAKEIEEIKQAAESDAEREKEEIISSTRKETERMKQLTLQEIESLTEAGIKELKQYTAELVSILALERIQRKMTMDDQVRIINRSIEMIDKSQ
jgi:F-type H+-transporting ATPase subunit b